MVWVVSVALIISGSANLTAWIIWNPEHTPYNGILMLGSGLLLFVHQWIEET